MATKRKNSGSADDTVTNDKGFNGREIFPVVRRVKDVKKGSVIKRDWRSDALAF